MDQPRIEVVLSTYAARQDWLEQQLESVWAQQGVDVTVLVRDDGSPDDTADRVATLLKGRPGRLVRGENVGPGRSFLAALHLADPDVPHVAFCDQDDVWLPQKLHRALDALVHVPPPAMYSARVEIVDEELAHLGLHPLPRRGHSFANALVQCAATGCTIVLDRAAVDLLNRTEPSGVVLHDAWAYLVVAGAGTSVYDHEAVVRYRQHGSNVVGVASTFRGRWVGRLRRQVLTGRQRVHTSQDQELRRLYAGALGADQELLLHRHLDAASRPFLSRVAYVMTSQPHRQDVASDVIYRLLFAVGRV